MIFLWSHLNLTIQVTHYITVFIFMIDKHTFSCLTFFIYFLKTALKSSQSDLNKVGLPENTTAVVSLAGQNILDPLRRWTEGFKQNVWASRVNTTRWDFIIIILCLFFLFLNLDM